MFAEYRLGAMLWAAGLVVIGLVLLLFNFNMFASFDPLAQMVLAALFATGAAIFFLSYFASRQDWARLIPAWTLLTLAAMALASTLSGLNQRITVSLLFMGLAIAFLNIYLLDRRQHWWAVIPGGIMLVIGIVIALSARISRAETLATLLFCGMGVVFLALYWLGGRPRQWWALVPGSVLLVFGLFIFTLENGESSAILRLWPVLLIVIGVVVGVASYRTRPGERLRVNSAPTSKRSSTGSLPSAQLGDYTNPAPGAAVEILPDPDE